MQHDASATQRTATPGRLVYLMGPSGAGKDSLIDAARNELQRHNVHVARRVITRSAEAKGEDALGVSAEQFERLSTEGALPCSGGPTAWRMAYRCRSMPG